MKKISKKILAVCEKIPVATYVLSSFIKSFFIAVAAVIALFGILRAMGSYAKLEAVLNLKFDSPIIIGPMWTFAALCLVCLVVGFLVYFHKYKRKKTKTDFYNAVAPTLGKK